MRKKKKNRDGKKLGLHYLRAERTKYEHCRDVGYGRRLLISECGPARIPVSSGSMVKKLVVSAEDSVAT